MATKTDRIEARLTPEERDELVAAAQLDGTKPSTFMVRAAVEAARDRLAREQITALPAELFDRLAASLDKADPAPGLARAVSKAKKHPRIR